MKKIVTCLIICLLLLNTTACVQSSTEQTETSQPTLPDVSKTDEENLVVDNNTFAMDLYQSLKETEGNFFYSPYSISSAMAMTYAGARGETEEQMAETLHFTLSQDTLHPTFNSISTALNNRGTETGDPDTQGFILKNVNAIWGQEDYKFLSEFLDTLSQSYGAGMRTLDFASEPEKSRTTINDWVSEQTENRINNLLPSGSITPLTSLVLTNAIYFKAAWFYQFDEERTITETFNLLDGSTVSVPMMKLTEYLNYTKGSGYQALELPYRNRKLSMVILLPEDGRFETFEEDLEYSKIQSIIDNLESKKVSLTMPKFKFSSDYKLKETLKEMGMPLAFSGEADFSGMSETGELFITEVCHKAFVSVDENGTEAAAATAVIMAGAAPGGPIDFTIDRPFIFLIRDIETGTILFIGRVMNPLAE